jgi:uncharacterized protein (TIGR02300 family)
VADPRDASKGCRVLAGWGMGAKGRHDAIDTAGPTSQVMHLLSALVRGIRIVAKAELGTKRLCANCGAKFYDLNKDPIVCPKCQTVMQLAAVTRARPEAARAAEEEAVVPETQEAEFVSLEEADAEAQGKKPPEGEATEGADEDIELEDEPIDDAAFIEEQEEGDEDVADIIGDVDNEEEA